MYRSIILLVALAPLVACAAEDRNTFVVVVDPDIPDFKLQSKQGDSPDRLTVEAEIATATAEAMVDQETSPDPSDPLREWRSTIYMDVDDEANAGGENEMPLGGWQWNPTNAYQLHVWTFLQEPVAASEYEFYLLVDFNEENWLEIYWDASHHCYRAYGEWRHITGIVYEINETDAGGLFDFVFVPWGFPAGTTPHVSMYGTLYAHEVSDQVFTMCHVELDAEAIHGPPPE